MSAPRVIKSLAISAFPLGLAPASFHLFPYRVGASKNYLHRNALFGACFLNKAGAVRIIMEHGCRTDIFTSEGFNAMHYAMVPCNFDIIKYLMSQNFSIQKHDGSFS